jgi:hypothetical protein
MYSTMKSLSALFAVTAIFGWVGSMKAQVNGLGPGLGENRRWVTDEPVEFEK